MSYGIEKEKHLGGYWNVKNIWGDPGTWSPEIWDKIIKDHSIESVVDIGCGLGFACKYFSQKGLYVTGIEGGLNAINNTVFSGDLRQNDYTVSSALNYEEYDLGWCCEFVEHVEEQFVDNFLADFEKCKHMAMTYAEPGKPGYHHVNCQPKEYWVNHMARLKFKLNEAYSNELQSIAKKLNNNGPFIHAGHMENILFFEK